MGCQSSCQLQSLRWLLSFTKHDCKGIKTLHKVEMTLKQLDTIKQDTLVQVYTEIRHNYWWFWHIELAWEYIFPESRTTNWGVINIHIVWRPMSLPESGMQKTWKGGVANQHGAKCVKCARLIIGACKRQNNTGAGQGEYSLSILMQFEGI